MIELVKGIQENGFATVPNFLTLAETSRHLEIVRECRTEFRRAGIGKNAATSDPIRGDSILWWQPESLGEVQKSLWERLQSLRQTLNRELFLGLWELELHYSIYPSGSHYQLHVDSFRSENTRVLSLVLYLNPDWTETDGGKLKIHEVLEINPVAGTLVCFLSEQIQHEVLKTHRERFSITGWFHRRK
jgi:SM-20-related protein